MSIPAFIYIPIMHFAPDQEATVSSTLLVVEPIRASSKSSTTSRKQASSLDKSGHSRSTNNSYSARWEDGSSSQAPVFPRRYTTGADSHSQPKMPRRMAKSDNQAPKRPSRRSSAVLLWYVNQLLQFILSHTTDNFFCTKLLLYTSIQK